MNLPLPLTKEHADALKQLFGSPFIVIADTSDGAVLNAWTFPGDLPTEAEAIAAVTLANENRIRSVRQPYFDQSDEISLRCFKAGVEFPAEWRTFTQALRDWPQSPNAPLPTVPATPAGI